MRMVNLTKISISSIKIVPIALLASLVACQSETKLKAEATSQIKQEPVVKQISTVINRGKWCFTMKVPDGNWGLKLYSVHQQESGDYVALALVSRRKGDGLQVIGSPTMCAPINLEGHSMKVYITGKTWGWKNTEAATFVKRWPTMDKASKLVYKPSKNDKPIRPGPVDSHLL